MGLGSTALASGALRRLDHDRGLLEGDHQRLGRVILQQGGQKSGPGTVARPRHQLFTWRGVTPASRAKAAWATPARARRPANSAPESVRMVCSV